MKPTKAEFIETWLLLAGLTVAQMQRAEIYCVECDCGNVHCHGWRMEIHHEARR